MACDTPPPGYSRQVTPPLFTSLVSALHECVGHHRLWMDGAGGAGAVCTQVGQQQGGAAVEQVQHVLGQALHRGVAHLFQVKDVLEEGEHLVLWKGRDAPVNIRACTETTLK